MSTLLRKLQDTESAKPYYGFMKLQLGFHKIYAFKVTKNKFGKKSVPLSNKSIMVELESQVVFLPSYFWTRISESDIDGLNAELKNEDAWLYFGGKRLNVG